MTSEDQIEELKKIRSRALNKERATITIDGVCNEDGELVQSFDETLKFSEDATHTISLTMLVIPALFPNLDDTDNKFFYNNTAAHKDITIDTGCYDIDEYGDTIRTKLKENSDNPDNITIKLNKGSGKVIIELEGNYKVMFKDKSWYKCLGFDLNQTLTNNMNISKRIANVTSTQVIHVECDLVDQRYNKYNGNPSKIIYSFPADQRYGELYEFRKDANVTAKILNSKHFDSIKLKFYDSTKKPITVLGQEINVEIQIIQV